MPHANLTTEILTLEEARRRLPGLRPHVLALMEISNELLDLNNTLEDLGERSGDHARERAALVARSRELMAAYEARMRAVNDMGATLKDPATGLLDFYAWKDDDLVFLCWKYGEDTIRWWHGLDGGFRGRRPVEA
jgi:hypothetical protein